MPDAASCSCSQSQSHGSSSLRQECVEDQVRRFHPPIILGLPQHLSSDNLLRISGLLGIQLGMQLDARGKKMQVGG